MAGRGSDGPHHRARPLTELVEIVVLPESPAARALHFVIDERAAYLMAMALAAAVRQRRAVWAKERASDSR